MHTTFGQHSRNRRASGFSLLELLVATAVFLVVAGSAFALFAQHQPLFNQQQGLASLNIAVRNATAQLQLDIVNAGANYYTGIDIPNSPVGAVIVNNIPSSNCQTSTTTYIYGSSCFDTLNVVAFDSNTVPANPSNGAGGCALSSTTAAYLSPAGSNGYATSALATTAAANYGNNDQILFVKSDGSQYTTVVLTAAASATVVGGRNYVLLTHGATATDGTNTSSTNDPLSITVNTAGNTMLGNQYCSSDFVLRLTPIRYSVDTSTPTNPKLTRRENGSTQTLAEQIIGFKVMAGRYNLTGYYPDNTVYNSNYTQVRSVRVSLIARTTPVTDPTYKFRNSFDGGPYQIQGTSVVVNPRNLSMTDN